MNFKVRTLFLTGLMSAMTACNKPNFRPTTNPYILSEKTLPCLDSLAKESKKILSDTSYKHFANDTILIPSYLECIAPKFKQRIQETAKRAIPKKTIGITKTETYYPTLRQFISEKVPQKAPLYEDPKIVIDNSIYYTATGQDVYVPVKYYGKPINQNIK